jgi:hypothetical protein
MKKKHHLLFCFQKEKIALFSFREIVAILMRQKRETVLEVLSEIGCVKKLGFQDDLVQNREALLKLLCTRICAAGNNNCFKIVILYYNYYVPGKKNKDDSTKNPIATAELALYFFHLFFNLSPVFLHHLL